MDSPQQNSISEPAVIAGFPEPPAGMGRAGGRRVSVGRVGFGLYAAGAAGTPDTEVGYRVADKLCDKTPWPGLSSRFTKSPDWLSSVTKHPAMDTADCFGELQALGKGTHSAQLELSVVPRGFRFGAASALFGSEGRSPTRRKAMQGFCRTIVPTRER